MTQDTQDTITKDNLKPYAAINTNYTDDELIHEINISGIIGQALDTAFTALAYRLDFLDISNDENKIIPYAEYVINTSPYHKNESVNIVSMLLEEKTGQQLGRPILRLLHKHSAMTITQFLNDYGKPDAITVYELFDRAKDKELHQNVRELIERVVDQVLLIAEPETLYQVVEEYVLVSLITGEYDNFVITTEDFVRQLTYALEDVEAEDADKPKDKPSHLRVIK